MTANDLFSLAIALLALAFGIYSNMVVTRTDREVKQMIERYDRMIQRFKAG